MNTQPDTAPLALANDCELDCQDACAYPGRFSECTIGAGEALDASLATSLAAYIAAAEAAYIAAAAYFAARDALDADAAALAAYIAARTAAMKGTTP